MPDDSSAVGANGGTGATATATPAPAAPAAQPGDLAQPVSMLPAPALEEQPRWVPRVDLANQNLPPNSFGAKLYHGILNALGGGQDVTFSRDETGQMVAHPGPPPTPGSQWKRIISGALTGFAGAQAAGTQGPGGALRGFAGGIRAGTQQALQQRTQARTEANEDYEAKLKTARAQLEQSLQQQQIAESAFRVQSLTNEAEDRDVANFNSFEQAIGEGGKGAEMVGSFKDAAELRKFLTDHPEIMARHVNGFARVMPNIVNGKREGLIAAVVTPDFLNTPIGEEKTLYQHRTVPDKNGKPQDTWEAVHVPANTKMGAYLSALGDTQKESDDYQFKQEQIKAEKDRARAAVMEATTGQTEAATRARVATSEIALNNVKAQTERDKLSEADFGVGGEKGFEKWHKELVEPALQVEQTYRLSSQVYNQYQQLRAQGKDFPSGAQSVQMLSNHIAGTFGLVKGGRVTKDLIEKHLGARGVSDTVQTAVQKLVDGDVLSENQWNAFFEMIGQRRDATWQMVKEDADALGRPAQYIAYPDDFRRRYGLPARVAPAETVLNQAAQGTPAPQAVGGAAAPQTLPPEQVKQLKEGTDTKFGNGQTWTLKNGQPVQVK